MAEQDPRKGSADPSLMDDEDARPLLEEDNAVGRGLGDLPDYLRPKPKDEPSE